MFSLVSKMEKGRLICHHQSKQEFIHGNDLVRFSMIRYACMHACMHVDVYVYMCICVLYCNIGMYICIYVCVCAYVYMYMYMYLSCGK